MKCDRPAKRGKAKAGAGAGAAVGIITFAWSVRKQALQSHPINDQLNSLTAKGSPAEPGLRESNQVPGKAKEEEAEWMWGHLAHGMT